MMKTISRLPYLLLAALCAVLAAGLILTMTANAAPATVSVVAPVRGNDVIPSAVVLNSSAITQDTNSTGVLWLKGANPHDVADVFTVIDQGTTNTITVKLQYSPDNSNWFDYATLASANTADASASYTTTVAGLYVRVNLDVANSNTITPTVKLVMR